VDTSLSNVVGIATTLRAGCSGVRISVEARDFFFSKTSSHLFNGHRSPFPGGQCDRHLKLTAYLHLVSKLRMSGAIPLLPLYACMVSAGKTWRSLNRDTELIPTLSCGCRLSHGFIAPRPLYTGLLCPTLEWFPSVISRGTPHLPVRETSISEGRKLKRI
jgi:hypothetical protein